MKTTTKKRQELICWNCGEQFSILLPDEAVDNLNHPCPYCAAECVVGFEPYSDAVGIFKGAESGEGVIEQLNLPEIIETQQPPKAEE